MNILLICDLPTPSTNASALAQYVESIAAQSKHNVYVLSNLGDFPPALNLDWFDAIAIHYSIYILGKSYLSDSARDRIIEFKGLKALFLQDEYRAINEMQIMIYRLGVDVLFTCMPPELQTYIYPSYILPGLRLEQVLTGYVPDELKSLNSPPIVERPIDVGYRGRDLRYMYGRAAQEKSFIGREFKKRAPKNLKMDISSAEEDRIYGEGWIKFLQSCKAVLGTESAVSLLDFTDMVYQRTEQYMRVHPHCTFEETEAECFPGLDGRFYTGQISPRCFEAGALHTPLILFEGKYSDIFEPWTHYIPLKKDFSNFDEVIAALENTGGLEKMAQRVYDDIILNPQWSFASFVARFDQILEEEFAARACAEKTKTTRKTMPSPDAFFASAPLRMHCNIRRCHGAYMVNCNGHIIKATAERPSVAIRRILRIQRKLHSVWPRLPRIVRIFIIILLRPRIAMAKILRLLANWLAPE